MLWELLFMLVILKIPVIYLCGVVWYAIRAEPEPADGGSNASEGEQPSPWSPWRASHLRRGQKPRHSGPHGTPARTYARASRPAGATSTTEVTKQ